MKLPSHIIRSLLDGRTSLSDHPAFPPEDEEKFIVRIVKKWFENRSEGIADEKAAELKRTLSKLMTDCEKLEEPISNALEQLCMKIITSLFDIPDDTVIIKSELSGSIDTSAQRKVPEPTDDFQFDDLEHMKCLTDEVYKRRLLDSIITGAAIDLSSYYKNFKDELDKIEPKLYPLYEQISLLNDVLIYLEKEKLSNDGITETGKVDVYLSSPEDKVRIEAQGTIFPTLLCETIKGILEVAISRGLPENREEAVYVTKKSDFSLAEVWDIRLGMPLWNRIKKTVERSGNDIIEVGANLFLMMVSELEHEDFNLFMQNVLLGTKSGTEMAGNLCSGIIRIKEREAFDNYVEYNNDKFPIEDGYFSCGKEILGEDE